jgi:hypothetical protein
VDGLRGVFEQHDGSQFIDLNLICSRNTCRIRHGDAVSAVNMNAHGWLVAQVTLLTCLLS